MFLSSNLLLQWKQYLQMLLVNSETQWNMWILLQKYIYKSKVQGNHNVERCGGDGMGFLRQLAATSLFPYINGSQQ